MFELGGGGGGTLELDGGAGGMFELDGGGGGGMFELELFDPIPEEPKPLDEVDPLGPLEPEPAGGGGAGGVLELELWDFGPVGAGFGSGFDDPSVLLPVLTVLPSLEPLASVVLVSSVLSLAGVKITTFFRPLSLPLAL